METRNIVYPIPAVMVSCGTMEKSNIITVAWTGTINTDPAMAYISVRPSRYSYIYNKKQKRICNKLNNKRFNKSNRLVWSKTGSQSRQIQRNEPTQRKKQILYNVQ